MADNIYALLQQALGVATTSDAKIFGVEIAIVTNVKDPEKQGRVKVCFPRLPGKPESDFVRLSQPAAGAGRGFYWLPDVNDEVLVAFERGEANKPYVLGSLWNGKDAPMKDAYTDENTTRMIQTKSGHQIIFDDAKDSERIVIADKSGKRTVTFDVKNKKFLIEAGEGSVEIVAAKKIIFDCEDLEIKTKKTGKLQIGTTFDLKVKATGQIKAGPSLDIKATRVDLNPSGGGGGGGGAGAMAAAAARAGATAQAAAKARGAGGAAAGAGPAALVGGPSQIIPTMNVLTEVPAPPRGAPAQKKEPDTFIDFTLVDANGAPLANTQVTILLADGRSVDAMTDRDGRVHLDRQRKGPFAGYTVRKGASQETDPATRSLVSRIDGTHFEFDKAFALPGAFDACRDVAQHVIKNPATHLVIVGHTDMKGNDDHNLKLSQERARVIGAYLRNAVETWMTFYTHAESSRRWGTREDQIMLSALPFEGTKYLLDAPSDTATRAVRDAMRVFQLDYVISDSLITSGEPDEETRRALIREYMAAPGTDIPEGAPVQILACGKRHPGSESDPGKLRRVEMFLFEGEPKPAPAECTASPHPGCTVHDAWEKEVKGVPTAVPKGATLAFLFGKGVTSALAPVSVGGDKAVTSEVAVVFSAKAPLHGYTDSTILPAANPDMDAVWAFAPAPDVDADKIPVHIYFHGNDGWVTADAAHPKGLRPDWTNGDPVNNSTHPKGEASGTKYDLDKRARTGKDNPLVLVPEEGVPTKLKSLVTVGATSGWGVTDEGLLAPGPPRKSAGRTLAPAALFECIQDACAHLSTLTVAGGTRNYLKAAPVKPEQLGRLLLSGHSGGGKPLREAAISDLAKKHPTDLCLLDCTYTWAGGNLEYVDFCNAKAGSGSSFAGLTNDRLIVTFLAVAGENADQHLTKSRENHAGNGDLKNDGTLMTDDELKKRFNNSTKAGVLSILAGVKKLGFNIASIGSDTTKWPTAGPKQGARAAFNKGTFPSATLETAMKTFPVLFIEASNVIHDDFPNFFLPLFVRSATVP